MIEWIPLSSALCGCFFACALANAQSGGLRVLVYTRNTVTEKSSYIHDNIADSVEALHKIGAANGFAVDATDDPAVFTRANLKRYKAIVFSNTHNQAFTTDGQRQAFQYFVQHGGGLVGLHAATTSEREWPFFVSAMGGKFVRHPKLQKFVVRVVDPKHPATRGMPASFEWEDECYFHDSLAPGLHPLLVTDPTALNDADSGKYPDSLVGKMIPLAWTITTDGRRVFYTALGHQKEHYSDPFFVKHIQGGLLWAMGKTK
jgi:type 1 glutamine amidotransferase